MYDSNYPYVRRRETSPDPSSDPAVADLSASVALLDRMTRRDLYRVVAEVPIVAGEKSKRIAGMGEEEVGSCFLKKIIKTIR